MRGQDHPADESVGGPTSDASIDQEDATPGEEPGADVHTTDRRTISPRIRVVWGLRLLAGVGALTLVLSLVGTRVDPVPSWAGLAVGGLLLAAGLGWIEARYRVWCYEVRADALYLERGVLTHVRTIAPFVRIQHVDTRRGPLERSLGLSTLVVYTAGSRGADVSIPGLQPAVARDLQTRVKELAIEAEGGDAV